ncbi:hypothetical protein [Phaeovulum sp. W22_SRMD_FR3]|uniref:hypothetical protein n=1 Tax=Phaeovulum sp. W22_SRMD_FR3 TaxID=3240274 RepID=UPI003F95F3A3
MRLFTGLNVSLANTAIGVIREQGQHGVARRRVATRAMVALARRVGVILHRTGGEDTAFRSGIAGPIRPDDSRSQLFPAETQAFAVPPGRGSDEAVVRIAARNTKHPSETGTSALHGTSIILATVALANKLARNAGSVLRNGIRFSARRDMAVDTI